jgi:hypothetical protein
MKPTLKILTICITILLFAGCLEKEQETIEEQSTSKQFNKTAGGCSCGTRSQSSCTDECTKEFMNNQDKREFKIIWESCDNNDLNSPNCKGSQGATNPSNGLPFVSNVEFCYQDWVQGDGSCALLMQIDFLPSCIKCITGFPRCIRFKAYCAKVDNNDGTTTNTLSLVADDPDVTSSTEVDGFEWTVTTVTGDPKIKICCEKTIGNFRTFFCCTGDIQPL